jgi:hypothetical protein
MPRRVKFHPSTMPISGGEPMDGDMAPDDVNYTHEDDDDEPGNGSGATDEIAQMRAEVERLKEENKLIRRAIPPAEPARAPAAEPADEMDDEEFDALLFSNPREALRINNERVKRELRNEYTNNQGTTKFWENFYRDNSDLKDDDDLVQSTLQKNMAELGNMPVDKAMGRLAELTRERILGFMKKRKEPRGQNRAIAEGSNPPSIPRGPAVDDDDDAKPTTMGDLLKSRRAKRRKAAVAA